LTVKAGVEQHWNSSDFIKGIYQIIIMMVFITAKMVQH
jgi:hypothetical protein